jgi:hypothetical protein
MVRFGVLRRWNNSVLKLLIAGGELSPRGERRLWEAFWWTVFCQKSIGTSIEEREKIRCSIGRIE